LSILKNGSTPIERAREIARLLPVLIPISRYVRGCVLSCSTSSNSCRVIVGSGCDTNGSGGCQREGLLVAAGLRTDEVAGLVLGFSLGFLLDFLGSSVASPLANALRARRSARRIVFVRSRPMADSSIEPTVLRMPNVCSSTRRRFGVTVARSYDGGPHRLRASARSVQ